MFYFWYHAEFLHAWKMLEHRVKALCRHQLDSYMFNKSCGCCFQQWDLAVSLCRATYSLDNNLGCMGILVESLMDNNQLDVTQSHFWKLLLVTRDGQLGLRLSHYLVISIGHLHLCTHFRIFLLQYVFILFLKCTLFLDGSPHIHSHNLLDSPIIILNHS